MTIRFPSVAELRGQSEKVQALGTYDFTKACFAVNVTGGTVQPSPISSKCEVSVGAFQGFVAPGSSISMSVPNGSAYKLEVYAFARTSSADPCPMPAKGMSGLDLTRVATVGTVPSFDALQPEVALNVEISAPKSNLAIDRGLAGSCFSSGSRQILANAAIAPGRAVQTGGGFKLIGVVSGTKNEVKLTGGGFAMQLSRRPQ